VEEESFLIDSATDLQGYLESNILFWPLRAHSQPLTPANLLLAERKFTHADLSSHHSLQNALAQIDEVRRRMRGAWQKKQALEFSARRNQFSTIIADLTAGEGAGVDYRVIARLRTLLQLLCEDAMDCHASQNSLEELDFSLRSCIVPGEFIWSKELEPVFPKSQFWFLYAQLHS
jgi:hypothetical protein